MLIAAFNWKPDAKEHCRGNYFDLNNCSFRTFERPSVGKYDFL